MEQAFVFDVDGTLTPSCGMISSDFHSFFYDFIFKHDVYFVTGSDWYKTKRQLGKKICHNVKAVYNCSGGEKTVNGERVWLKEWEAPEKLSLMLQSFLDKSKWEERYDIHIENRETMINFSVIGRACPREARDRYDEWDKQHKEREAICRLINAAFPEVSATMGGQISIDICPNDLSKASILDDVDEFHNKKIIFFGDRIHEGGNDYPLAQRIQSEHRGFSYKVKDWQQTWNILKSY